MRDPKKRTAKFGIKEASRLPDSRCGSRRLFEPGRQRCCCQPRHALNLVHPVMVPIAAWFSWCFTGMSGVGEAHESSVGFVRYWGLGSARDPSRFRIGKVGVGMCIDISRTCSVSVMKGCPNSGEAQEFSQSGTGKAGARTPPSYPSNEIRTGAIQLITGLYGIHVLSSSYPTIS
ncbi:hypothetical protein M426DRAFT_123261 [Hypoxylon sp. CI-4A]|nr:hypothetical protein M426DRAFT_123261 [Hypoxylon sp. CI-4A]